MSSRADQRLPSLQLVLFPDLANLVGIRIGDRRIEPSQQSFVNSQHHCDWQLQYISRSSPYYLHIRSKLHSRQTLSKGSSKSQAQSFSSSHGLTFAAIHHKRLAPATVVACASPPLVDALETNPVSEFGQEDLACKYWSRHPGC